ncbi:MAG: hypothetical protein FWF35_05160 [Elusimicrobia bacterium]|nr:hypothetical protein [Elusimicrobiota bacterium]
MKNVKALTLTLALAFIYSTLFAVPIKNGTNKQEAAQVIAVTQPAGGLISSGNLTAVTSLTSIPNTLNNTSGVPSSSSSKKVAVAAYTVPHQTTPDSHGATTSSSTAETPAPSQPVSDPDAAFYWTTKPPYVVTIDPDDGIFENQTPLSFYARYPKVDSDGTAIEKQGCNFYTPSNINSLYLVIQTPCGGNSNSAKELQYIFPKSDSDNRIIFTNAGEPMADRDGLVFRNDPPLGAVLYDTPQGKGLGSFTGHL